MPFYCECGREVDDMWIPGDSGLMIDCSECGVHRWGEGPGTVDLAEDVDEMKVRYFFCDECRRRFRVKVGVYEEYNRAFVCEDHPDIENNKLLE